VLVGRAIAGRRDEVQLATKVGIDRSMGAWVLRGEPAYIKRGCEASLLRLGVETIDLYYLHRPPQTAPLEDAVGALAELVAEGKVRHIGLSEVDGDQLRRASAIHPIAVVQSEYSLWSRDVETAVVDALRELGAGLVAYAPLGRGFLTGALRLGAGDARRRLPRFSDEALAANEGIAAAVRTVAEEKGATPAQVALAWVVAQSARLGVQVVPIPGTKHVARLEENAAALTLELSEEDLAALDPLAAQVVGGRY
jgi:aryl-alcohol dehydrogenase-like predicted oxidoreductase